MAALTGVAVESVRVDLPESGVASSATIYFGLAAKTPTGDVVRVTANILASDFPTDETTFMSVLWTGAFLNAYDVIGHSIPDDPEWSPWPIV